MLGEQDAVRVLRNVSLILGLSEEQELRIEDALAPRLATAPMEPPVPPKKEASPASMSAPHAQQPQEDASQGPCLPKA